MMKSRQKHKSFSYLIYRIIRWLVRIFYPSIEVEGQENLPDEACVIVGNHCQMNGPIVAQLFFPGNPHIWCAAEMMHLREVPQYAFEDFWRDKPKRTRWFYKLLSYAIAPLSACVFNSADTIAVYRDARLVNTFRQTIQALKCGANVIIFPEHRENYNHIVNRFQEHFIDVARLYYKHTGKKLSLVPLYIAPNLRKAYIGKPVVFEPDISVKEERQRICRYLMDAITDTAVNLPPHIVVPYTNMPKTHYSRNLSKGESVNEIK